MRALQVLVFLICTMAPTAALAHTLGIDRAELVETAPGAYRLTSEVPPSIAPAIRTPELPPRCTFAGNPSGERGTYSVTFSFNCAPALTADDTLILPWRREGALLAVAWYGEDPVTRLASRDGATIEVRLGNWLAGSGSLGRAASRYTLLGIEHILSGLDHLLFVLALLFVVQGGWRLVKTITAFTVAHSITLGLATLGYITLPSAPVEAAIALSIAFMASEILRNWRGSPSLTFAQPWLVAFAFGLLHGLGFAGALLDIGLPRGEVALALLFFNIGVEIGQLIFVVLALFTAYCIRNLVSRKRVLYSARVSLVYVIGTLATYWFVERTAEIFTTA